MINVGDLASNNVAVGRREVNPQHVCVCRGRRLTAFA